MKTTRLTTRLLGGPALRFQPDGRLVALVARPRLYPQRDRRATSVAANRRAPAAFAELVDACLSREPGDRPSVGELADGLDEIVGP